jgi:hypothetical protein
MSFIIYPQENGQIAVIIPTSAIEDCIKDVPAGVEYAIVESLEGVDNDYFIGFIYEDGTAVADINKCKSIHLYKFRAARAPKLAALDVAFMKAVEQADAAKQSEIAASKQALRDVTKTPLPDTLPEIKEVWPTILN